MTARAQQAGAAPPRSLVRAFWALHRAIVRLSRNRLGLWRPKPGRRFGTMRLDTIGRSSGRSRTAILGYFEDGANFVTLAMNGWADASPAWWLNLQARSDATLTCGGRSTAVRARVATGPERERLWAAVTEYPGWGHDIEALAARRSTSTPVVVFEPVDVPTTHTTPTPPPRGGATEGAAR